MTGRDPAVIEAKQRLRAEARQRLAQITPERRVELSERAAALLSSQPLWKKARAILGYAALRDELDLSAALAGARAWSPVVALPRHDPGAGEYRAAIVALGETLARGAFGVVEPSARAPHHPLNQLDFVLVPGLAFDLAGGRLGRGRGFYDRLLAQAGGIKCGVALDEQVLDSLPAEAHDARMDFLLTPTRWLALPPAQPN